MVTPPPVGPHLRVFDGTDRTRRDTRRVLKELGAGIHQVARRMRHLLIEPRRPGAHQQLSAARTRHGHVGQATLLTLRVLPEGSTVLALQPLLEGSRRILCPLNVELKRRQICSIPSQRMRQRAGVGHPCLVRGRIIRPRSALALVQGERAIGQPKHHNPIPFKALRAVDGQDLHGVRVRFAQRCIQPILAFLCHIQIRQERPEGRTRGFLLVGRSDRNELIERRTPTHRQRIRDHIVQGAHDEDRPLDLLGNGTPHTLANLPQAFTKQPHAAHGLLADRGPPLGRPPGLRRGIHRIQKDRLMRVNTLLTCQETCPVAQRHQVGCTQVNASQQASQPRGCLHVVCQFQGGAHILHGRLIEQTTQAHDLRRDPSLTQGIVDQRKVPTLPAQHGDAAPLAVLNRLRAHPLHEIDHRAERLIVILRESNVDGSGPRPTPGNQDGGLRLELLLAHLEGGHLPQGCRHPVRSLQDRHIVAPRGRQRERLSFFGRARLETIQEGLQGRGRGSPPAVNRLIRVSHCGDRMICEEH